MSGTGHPGIGRRFPPASGKVEQAAISAFARAIGETNPIYFETTAARAAGFRAIPAPPTFIFCIKYQAATPVAVLEALGINGQAGDLLHAEQNFEYFKPVCAGDTLTFSEHVADIYEKKGGALLFIVLETSVTNQSGELVAKISHTEVKRS